VASKDNMNKSSWIDPLRGTPEVGKPRHRHRSQKTPRIERFVLKLNGKIISDSKLQHRALVWAADDLWQLGLGGGIASLLLPRTAIQRQQLQSDRRKYTLDKVRVRDKGRRGAMRDVATSPEVLPQLIALYPSHKASKKDFGNWVFEQVATPRSKVRALLALRAPELIEDARSAEWWRRLQVRKMSR